MEQKDVSENCPVICPLLIRLDKLEKELDRGENPGAKAHTDLISSLRNEVDIIKHDITHFNRYFEKLDITIEKLTEVIECLQRLVTLQGEKLDFLKTEKIEEITRTIETQKTDSEKTIIDLKNDLEELKISSDFRIHKLELWKYLVLGGSIVIGFIVKDIVADMIRKIVYPQSQTTIQMQVPQNK